MRTYGPVADPVQPCAGHPCDECATCRRGRCCRGDDPDYRLPEPGSWDGPIYGDVGVLREDGEKVECHICGGWYAALGVHAWRAHNVSGDEYRALFGLARGHGLSGADLRTRQRAIALFEMAAGQRTGLTPLTGEQRAKGLESVRRPRPEHQRKSADAINTGRRRFVDRMASDDPYNEQFRRTMRAAKGSDPLAEVGCPICGRRFYPGPPSHPRLTCSPACSTRWTARRQIVLPPDLYHALVARATGSVEELALAAIRAWLDTGAEE